MGTTIQGTGGSAALGAYTTKLNNWIGNLEIGITDTTGFEDGDATTCAPVYASCSGSAAGTLVYNASGTAPIANTLDGGSIALSLVPTTGKAYAFNAVITNVSISRPCDGKADVSFDFESDGAITQDWTT